MVSFHHAAIATAPGQPSSYWLGRWAPLRDALHAHHGPLADYAAVRPFESTATLQALRRDLVTAAPALGGLADDIGTLLRTHRAVFFPEIGWADLDVTRRALLSYALSVCLGEPTATDARQIIWDVKARGRSSEYFSTFSETGSEAAYHTDAQYFPAPERTFLLYCMREARCGGGLSSLCDAAALRADLEARHPALTDLLRVRALPFRVPSAFVTGDDTSVIEATLAPVLADAPLVRYRRDTLEQGLRYFPEYRDPDVDRALQLFARELASSPHQVEFAMPTDSLLVVDNHLALHARSAFQDQERHMLRIRLRWDRGEGSERRWPLLSRRRNEAPVSHP